MRKTPHQNMRRIEEAQADLQRWIARVSASSANSEQANALATLVPVGIVAAALVALAYVWRHERHRSR